MNGKTALERAFELADQGRSMDEIRAIIHREGYDVRHLYGPTISAQLNERIHAAKGEEYKRRGGRRTRSSLRLK